MNKKTLTEVLRAIMATAGLDPDFDEDYYQSVSAESISRFCEGACTYFNKPREYWMFHFCNIGYLDSPSKTIKFFIDNSESLFDDAADDAVDLVRQLVDQPLKK